ncbi:MAG TPA: AsmA family protein, partial [Rhodocyclaceae bacterium]|nr:AsmA family protein [Rhodocyclaceae bacterium]
MKMLVRMLAVIAAALALVVGALAAYVALVFDPNDYRDQLAEQVARHSGRALTIDGGIGLSLFPWLGAELTDVSLANAPGFGDEPFARIARAHARVRLWPLLRGEVEVDRVLLDGLALRLERDADGLNNWDDLLARSEAGAPQPARPASGTADVLGGVAALAVRGVAIEAATLSWHDRQRGTQQRFDDIRLRTGEIRPGAAFPLELGLDVESSAPAVSARIELTGEVMLAADGSRLDIEPLALRVRGQGEDWPGGEGLLELDAVVRHELDTGTLTLSPMAVRGFGVEARSEVTVHTAGEDGPRYAGTLDVAEFGPRELLAALGQPVDTADPQVLQAARVRARFDGSTAALAGEPFELRIDDSTLAGKLGVSDFARGALSFDLALDALDLDRYLPPQSEPAAVATP